MNSFKFDGKHRGAPLYQSSFLPFPDFQLVNNEMDLNVKAFKKLSLDSFVF